MNIRPSSFSCKKITLYFAFFAFVKNCAVENNSSLCSKKLCSLRSDRPFIIKNNYGFRPFLKRNQVQICTQINSAPQNCTHMYTTRSGTHASVISYPSLSPDAENTMKHRPKKKENTMKRAPFHPQSTCSLVQTHGSDPLHHLSSLPILARCLRGGPIAFSENRHRILCRLRPVLLCIGCRLANVQGVLIGPIQCFDLTRLVNRRAPTSTNSVEDLEVLFHI